jgi:Na+-translocating ferredoxin:NAD+ oxidoreductase RNF subunit RnfB
MSPLLRSPREDVVEMGVVSVEGIWQVLPTFVCGKCGWIGAINEAEQIYCDNRKCENYGHLFAVKVITSEIKELGI